MTAIRVRSLRERKPKASVLRDIVNKGLTASNERLHKTTGEALLELAAIGKKHGITGPTDLSTNHDDYLYGDKE
jgi:hypothetical protein